MKFLYARLSYAPHWREPQGWQRFGARWYKWWPLLLMVTWANLDTAKMWDL